MPYAGELSALATAVLWTGSALAFARGPGTGLNLLIADK